MMSSLTFQPSKTFTPRNRRRQWQLMSQRQHSFSLDIPQNIYDSDKLSRVVDNVCFTEPLRTREEDRVFLYLPRNLSYCEVCSDVIRDHVKKKVRLLSRRLSQYEDVPPTPVETKVVFGVGNDVEAPAEDNSRPPRSSSCSFPTGEEEQSRHPLPILRRARATSFPAPRREGKKVVRFADALGLELESVRYLVQKDLPRMVSSGATLHPEEGKKGTTAPAPKKVQLMPAFIAPSLCASFSVRLRRLKVSLHSVSTADSTVYGIVSVVNVTFHKLVFVRYTVNDWASHHDELAAYLEGSSEGGTDKFSFTLFCSPSDLCTQGHSLFFAVCYETDDGDAFWDNNGGKNYCIRCETREIPVVGNHSWVHFL